MRYINGDYICDETNRIGLDTDSESEVVVDMNASLFRQIKHAEKQHRKFQELLDKFYKEAEKYPDHVRRVR